MFHKILDDFLKGYLDDLIIFTILMLGEVQLTSLDTTDNPRHMEQV